MRPAFRSESPSHVDAAAAHSRTACFLSAKRPTCCTERWLGVVVLQSAIHDLSGAGAWEVSSVLHDSAHHGSAAMLVADLSRSRRMLDTVINDSVWHPAMMTQFDVPVAPTLLSHLPINDVKSRRVLHSMLQAHGQNFPLHVLLTIVKKLGSY